MALAGDLIAAGARFNLAILQVKSSVDETTLLEAGSTYEEVSSNIKRKCEDLGPAINSDTLKTALTSLEHAILQLKAHVD